MRFTFFASVAFAFSLPGLAHAATCEESFTKKGNPLTGIKYHAEVTVAGVTPQVALQQLRGAAGAKGYDILADESANGQMLIAKPKSFGAPEEKSVVQAVSTGPATVITMDTKLGSGTFSSGKDARADYCGMLNSIQGGKAGIAAAKRGQNAVSAAPPRTVDAVLLSQEIAEEGEANAAAVNARYQGKLFIVKGNFDRIFTTRDMNFVYFKTPDSTNDLLFRSSRFRRLPTISCIMAPGQSVFTLSLSSGARMKLRGEFDRYDHLGHRFVLKNCAPSA